MIKNVALIGLGAVGGVFAKAFYDTFGNDFAVIAGGTRQKRIVEVGLSVNGEALFPHTVTPDQTDWKADFIIIAVKNYQLEEALNDIKNIVFENTIILPVLNGITAQERTAKVYPQTAVLHALTFIDSVKKGADIVSGSGGKIQFGTVKGYVSNEKLQLVKDALDKAGIENEICEDMLRAQWKKWMINIGMNQTSAIIGNTYGDFIQIEEIHTLMQNAMRETLAVAKKLGIDLTEEDIITYDEKIKTFIPNGKTSMLQDVEAKRRTEVDYFAGTLIEIAEKAGIEVPINKTFYCLIKGIEKRYLK